MRNCLILGPYSRPMPRVLEGWAFLMGEVPLHASDQCIWKRFDTKFTTRNNATLHRFRPYRSKPFRTPKPRLKTLSHVGFLQYHAQRTSNEFREEQGSEVSTLKHPCSNFHAIRPSKIKQVCI